MKTITYNVVCSKKTHHDLDEFLEQQRQLWNAALEQRIDAWKKKAKSLTFFDQNKELTDLRKYELAFSKFSLPCQRSILNRLHKSFQNFFRRLKSKDKPGFPRFKGKNRLINSFEIPDPLIKTVNNRKVLIIKGIGKFRFKTKKWLPLVSVRLCKTARRIVIQLVIETDTDVVEDNRLPLGVDAGIKKQVTLSNGIQTEGRNRNLLEVKKRQRLLSKAVKWSNNRAKKKLLLAKSWQRVRESERGYLHRLTSFLIQKHSSKYFIEDLKIKNMAKNKHLARSIHEQMWGTFYRLLTYKAEDAGGWVKKVNPKNTSQRCSHCGHLPREKIDLSVRVYSCESCGIMEDRDINAGRNILQRGLSSLPGVTPSGPGVFGEGRLQPAMAG